eukprot:COSAG02_NODE_32143_length_521_cov_1.414692_2_plen_64_part_01
MARSSRGSAVLYVDWIRGYWNVCVHTLIKRPMHLVPPMQISEITDSAFCKKRARGAGLGVVLVE